MPELRCPNNPDHRQFSATAHEVRGWIVDETGFYIKDDGNGCEVATGPDFHGSVCMVQLPDGTVCGAETIINEE